MLQSIMHLDGYYILMLGCQISLILKPDICMERKRKRLAKASIEWL